MVAPIYIIAIALGVAFLLPLFDRYGKTVLNTLFLSALFFFIFISAQWMYAFLFQGMQTIQIFTAGFKPPISINLQMGPQEAVLLSAINSLAFLGALYLLRYFNGIGVRAQVLFLLLTLGMNGLVMTRDIFNMFVFIEITSIATYALIGMDLNLQSLTAGFKYMIAGGIASNFLLLGIIFLYSFSGTLNIDGMVNSHTLHIGGTAISISIFLLLMSFFIEMKQFPANGWALDVYQGAHPGIAAIISTGSSGAMFFALYKILPIAGAPWFTIMAGLGLLTFVVSNLMGLKQQSASRLLGYSSVSQMGLLLAVLGLGFQLDPQMKTFLLILTALFFNHFIAKAGLFWLAGMVQQDSIKEWRVLRGKPIHQFLMGTFLLALLGFPPFAGFWGKWSLVMALAEHHMFTWIILLLLGSLLEAVYLLRWFGYAVKGKPGQQLLSKAFGESYFALWALVVSAFTVGYLFSRWVMPGAGVLYLPVLGAGLLFLLDGLSVTIKGSLAVLLSGIYTFFILQSLSGFALYFGLIFLLGSFILMLATLNRQNKSIGFYPTLILMIGALSNLILARDLLQFFFSWELMTVASYLLILRGKQAERPALIYVIFSLGGAFLILTGIACAHSVLPGAVTFNILNRNLPLANWVYSLIAIGFLVKLAGIGLHIWAPAAYAEAEDDTSPFISAILSKAGILGFIILLIHMGSPFVSSLNLNTLLGWIGALTAFFATLFAIFQEDAKKLLAYSSIGQVGYIVLGLAVMSHLGWAAALWHTVNHMLFKGLLFLAIAGVVARTGTRQMYEMGGLIKKMPFSFISVLIGIIALSGIPPLTGFGGKWLLYEALIERGWYLQTALAFFASTIAFLYCYRLIHTIFLGQPKPRFKEIKEAPLWILIPQYILIAFIMLFSIQPQLLLKPISRIIDPIFVTTFRWEGLAVYNSLGYWNGTIFMIMVGVIFVLVTIYLMVTGPRPQKVKQFNIVYSAERPEQPETTHFAYQFYMPYRRAMAPILKPLVTRFWSGVSEWTHTLAGGLRLIYTGNAQTYALYIFILGIFLYLFSTGVY